MKFKSDVCVGKTGEPLNSYEFQGEAASHAAYLLREHGTPLVAYDCTRCGYWHLSPCERQTASTACGYCKDSKGLGKSLYHTQADAERRIEIIRRERGESLNVYRCPSQAGWHLTHQPRRR